MSHAARSATDPADQVRIESSGADQQHTRYSDETQIAQTQREARELA